jgi:beta-glucosidase
MPAAMPNWTPGDIRPSRRALMLGASAFAAWMASPARALMHAATIDAERLPARIEALLLQMTIEEKAGQLTLLGAAIGGAVDQFNPVKPDSPRDRQLAQIRSGQLGAIFGGITQPAANILQTAAVKESRLGVPLLFGADVIHGFRTIFPVPLAEASSFDPALAERTARVAATEAAAVGIDWVFAPMVDIARDARWGRGVEGAGEDVRLGRDFAAARVRGFQGRSLSDNDAVLACPKHFAGYGASEGGLDYNSVDVSERTLREIYLPPFKAAFDAGALSTMAAFVDLSGVPATANPWLLDQVLRHEWGFDGFVVTDFTGDKELVAHGLASDDREAVRLAIMAGVDMSMSSGLFLAHLPDLVAKGEVPMARVDQAVRRVLAVKAKLGLFDDPFRRIDPAREKARVRTRPNLALAREAARRSIVMLKNDGGLLPLPRSGKRIALIGPFAEGQGNLNGPWTVFGSEKEAVDLATGIHAGVADAATVVISKGSGIDTAITGGIEAAVAVARDADIVVLAIGESQSMSGESQSRANIIVPPAQQALAEALAATGKPMVVLLRNGRALALEGAVLNAPAILVTWFLGSETGPAIADILFGKESPSGRLPVSFPREPGQEPYYYAHKSTGRPVENIPLEMYKTHYAGVPNTALFPFGHGLTYGQIEYAGLDLGAASLRTEEKLSLAATISNRGAREAVEVVQLYVQDIAASITRPVRELKAYRRVKIAPGASEKIVFDLTPADLGFLGRDLKPRIEPGMFRIWIAPSAEAEGVSGVFTFVSG